MSVVSLAVLSALVAGNPSLKIVRLSEDSRRVSVIAELSNDQIAAVPEGTVIRSVGRRLLTFAVVEKGSEQGHSMLGDYRRTGSQLIFAPRFRLSAGVTYRARFNTGDDAVSTVTHRVASAIGHNRAVVNRVFPSTDTLPANSLKFYIHFSQPMREGRAIFERIHLLDEQGHKVHDPWRRTELWTQDAQRFTLWIHPGRVKRGVNLREDFGPVLETDRKYTLLIEQTVQSQDGQPLQEAYRKEFRTIVDDRTQPLPQTWKLSVPAAGTRMPLRLNFGEPLDHALVQRCVSVRARFGQRVKCHMTLQNDDSVALLTPEVAWQQIEYHVAVDPILEDLAGNTPVRIFDTDLTAKPGPSPQLEILFRPARSTTLGK